MGNCGNKPATAEGEAPVAVEKVPETTDREIVMETKVITTEVDANDPSTPRSLAQMLEEEEKKPEVVEAAKPAETSTPAVETAKAEPSEPKKEETKPADLPAKVEEKKVEEKKP